MNPSSVPKQTAEQLRKLMDSLLVDCHVDLKEGCDSCGFSASQYQTILALGNSPQTMQQIAKSIQVSASAATRVVEQLVKRKLIKRLPDAHDRRTTWIRLTPKGARQMLEVKQVRLDNARDILSRLNPVEWGHLIEYLLKLEAASRSCRERAWQQVQKHNQKEGRSRNGR